MQFSENWLREWVNPAITTNELAHQLTMAGLEVEAVSPAGQALDKVVIGQVKSLEPHPDADKLRVCQVDVGSASKELLNIVCGAANVAAGGKYPVAMVGANLPGGLKIKKAKLRGVPSLGMLCSTKELALSEAADGLFTLPEDAPVGTAIAEFLQLNDQCIELSLTPNRGDCLSIAGIAREAGVLNRCDLTKPAIPAQKAAIKDVFPVEIEAGEHCPRYVGRVIKGIDPKAKTPMWMQEKLRRSGLRSLGPVVDVTNYVLLELGQPMHAFDLNKLQGGIKVRLSKEGEPITLLDGQAIKLREGALVIADQARAQALAGIMGGADSAVSDGTCDIFLESAYFEPAAIAGRARSYGLHTDSSHRFERGVDPALQGLAVERATQLLLEIVGGSAGPVIDINKQVEQKSGKPIVLRPGRIKRVLGIAMSAENVEDILKRLDMTVTAGADDSWAVCPPSFRFDIEREEDLIEELARIHGYDAIPASNPSAPAVMVARPEQQVSLEKLQGVLLERGYQEAITYSFVDPQVQHLLHPDQKVCTLANPISSDLSDMRLSLWPGLLTATAHNLNRQQENVRLFETGLCFYYENNELVQEPMVAGVICGSTVPKQWGVDSRALDFFDAKSDVEAILDLSAENDGYRFEAQSCVALHPGQSARVMRLNGEAIGWLGAIHPALAQKLDLPLQLYLFELKLSAVLKRRIPVFEEISKFPAIRRDLAIVVDQSVTAQKVSDVVQSTAEGLLADFRFFDVYQGKGIDPEKKSLAFGMVLQDATRTLTDEDVDVVIEKVIENLGRELGANLR